MTFIHSNLNNPCPDCGATVTHVHAESKAISINNELCEKLVTEWQQALSEETDTKKYRLIMQTIAFLQSIRS